MSKAAVARYRASEKGKLAARLGARKRYQANPEHYRLTQRLYKFKLTRDAYESMLAGQDGLCAVCREAPATDIDHDHTTGVVRGILCHHCNVGLGHFRDSIDLLDSASDYIKRSADMGS